MSEDLVLISGAVVFKKSRGKKYWFIVKEIAETSSGEVDEWELPKVIVRKNESSVRASIRNVGEKGGINARVLEEVGRFGGSTSVNGKSVPQRHIYYLMVQIVASEVLGFEKTQWLEYAKAVRKLSSKREQQVLRNANKELKTWQKENVGWITEQRDILAEKEKEEAEREKARK